MLQQAELHGVVPACNGRFEALQQSAVRWSNRLKQAIAVCNGLTFISQHSVVGNDLERKLFKTVEARFQVELPCIVPFSVISGQCDQWSVWPWPRSKACL